MKHDNNHHGHRLTMTKLKELITQVLQDSYNSLEDDYPEQLLAEPQEPLEDPPDPLNEDKIMTKLIRALNQVDEETRRKVFQRFGYYTQANLLRHLNSVKKASTGKL